jgi:hypothetical protein
MLFGFKILFVISLISLYKICNRPSEIRCLNSDGTGDLSLLRYKPDFVTFDVVNDVNQDFSLKYSSNKMGINDVINKLSINNTRANLLH